MSTKSSIFYKAFDEGGEIHVFYEMRRQSYGNPGYYLSLRVPFVMDITVPLPHDEMEEIEIRVRAMERKKVTPGSLSRGG